MNYLVSRFSRVPFSSTRVNVLLKIGNPFIGGILGHSGITLLHDIVPLPFISISVILSSAFSPAAGEIMAMVHLSAQPDTCHAISLRTAVLSGLVRDSTRVMVTASPDCPLASASTLPASAAVDARCLLLCSASESTAAFGICQHHCRQCHCC